MASAFVLGAITRPPSCSSGTPSERPHPASAKVANNKAPRILEGLSFLDGYGQPSYVRLGVGAAAVRDFHGWMCACRRAGSSVGQLRKRLHLPLAAHRGVSAGPLGCEAGLALLRLQDANPLVRQCAAAQ